MSVVDHQLHLHKIDNFINQFDSSRTLATPTAVHCDELQDKFINFHRKAI